jgi:hypothetical protein
VTKVEAVTVYECDICGKKIQEESEEYQGWSNLQLAESGEFSGGNFSGNARSFFEQLEDADGCDFCVDCTPKVIQAMSDLRITQKMSTSR